MMADALTVIMVEDDDGHAALLRRHLRRGGVTAEPVRLRDGQELLDYLHRRDPWSERGPLESVAVLLDLNLPRRGGVEVLELMRKHEVFGRIPVFVLTTTDDPAELDRCYALGASACLVKPVEYGAFGELVQRLGGVLMNAWLPGEVPVQAHER
jgi:CheY-like chemotaxis protein